MSQLRVYAAYSSNICCMLLLSDMSIDSPIVDVMHFIDQVIGERHHPCVLGLVLQVGACSR
jgi:hypothetical protein